MPSDWHSPGGYCAETSDGRSGDCELGDKGTFKLSRAQTLQWSSLRSACVQRCQECSRCSHVSFSVDLKDCSWFNSCDRPQASGSLAQKFRTVHVPRNTTTSSGARAAAVTESAGGLVARRKSRAALKLDGAPWPWVTPHAAVSVALVLFGKVGTLEKPSSFTAADGGDERLIRLSHASLKTMLLDANPRARVETFIHSWNPALGPLLNELYAPTWSSHEPQVHSFRLPSASLSLRRALGAVEAHGAKYDLVAALRHDLLFLAPLRWAELPTGQIWFPAFCCPTDSVGIGARERRESIEPAYRAMRDACYDDVGSFSDMCRVGYFLRMSRRDKDLLPSSEYNYWINDWMWVAPPRTALSFGGIGERLPLYAEALKHAGIPMTATHFVWSAHLHHALEIAHGVRATLWADVEVVLARDAVNERKCATNVSVRSLLPRRPEPVWGGMQAALCPMRGTIVCWWKSSPRCSANTPNAEPPMFVRDRPRVQAARARAPR